MKTATIAQLTSHSAKIIPCTPPKAWLFAERQSVRLESRHLFLSSAAAEPFVTLLTEKLGSSIWA